MVFLKGTPYPDFSTISIDNYMGAYLATRHLLDQGCRHIAHISGPLDWWEAAEREKGWRSALQDAGLPPSDKQCVQGNWSSSSSEKPFQSLLDIYPEVDGVFAGNDQMALSVLYVAHKQGIKIPEQLAVVGFDDLAESPYYSPSLTTVRQDLRTLGTMAVKKAIEMVNEPDITGDSLSDTIVIKPQLIVRESSLFGKTF
jgi:DNA-binding LacI/PurR family transcriptional regulator